MPRPFGPSAVTSASLTLVSSPRPDSFSSCGSVGGGPVIISLSESLGLSGRSTFSSRPRTSASRASRDRRQRFDRPRAQAAIGEWVLLLLLPFLMWLYRLFVASLALAVARLLRAVSCVQRPRLVHVVRTEQPRELSPDSFRQNRLLPCCFTCRRL